MKTKLITAAALAATMTVASAQIVVSGNWCSVANIQGPGDAGVVRTAPGDWNDLTSATGVFNSVDDITNPLTSNHGALTGATISWVAGDQDAHDLRTAPASGIPSDTANGDEQLFGGFLYTSAPLAAPIGPGGAGMIQFSGAGILTALQAKFADVPSYDLYLYIDGEDGGGTGTPPEVEDFMVSMTSGSLAGTTFYGEDNDDFILGNPSGVADYSQITSTTPGAFQPGNYVLFEGITSDDFTVMISGGVDGAGAVLNGFQIVAVPEPSTYAAGIIGALLVGIVLIRRRNRK